MSGNTVSVKADARLARGCVLGAALGDALGAAFEFKPVAVVAERTGKTWIDGLHPRITRGSAHGVWAENAPAGTGTDDTRYNWLFLELAAELARFPSDRELARRMLDVHDTPERFFPKRHAAIAREQFDGWRAVCHGCLGEPLPERPELPMVALRDQSMGGLNFPTLIGLISMTCAGALIPGDPSRAYREAYLTDFQDLAYGREAVALLAASISSAVGGNSRPRDTASPVYGLDPFALRGRFGGPFIKDRLPKLLAAVEGNQGSALAERLSRELAGFHAFDPYKTLAIAWAAVLAHPADPFDALLVAVNIRSVQADGSLGDLQDIDCYGCVTGALAGAFCGDGAFPPGMLSRVVESNKSVYGMDLEATCRRLSG